MPFAVFIMLLIILGAFATVVGVIYFGMRGEEHDTHNSAAVAAWTARVASMAPVAEEPADAPVNTAEESTAKAEQKPEASATSTGQSIGDLSDEEKESRRQAALERRKARAAKQAAQND